MREELVRRAAHQHRVRVRALHVAHHPGATARLEHDLRAAAAEVPLDRLLVETDAPYLAPMPFRGKRNEPAWVRHTAECLAEVKGIPVEELAEATTANALRVFGLESSSGDG